MNYTITKASSLKGEICVPGDKSISHRAVMFGAISGGLTEITGFLQGADCLSTIACFRQMGIEISNDQDRVLVSGKGLHGLAAPEITLDAGNSGTTVRLLSGILCAQPFSSTLTGDASIQKRPMRRIMEPLSSMGADIRSTHGNDCAPLSIRGRSLHGIHYVSKVASAQVKSSILLAGLYADSPTTVEEPYVSRNHSELMLRYFGADVRTLGNAATILPAAELTGQKVIVPADISSASYFIAAGLLTPGSEILLKNVGINSTRDGILRVVKAMGGKVTILSETSESGEPAADILVQSSALHGTTIGGELIPTLIDEIPVIAVMAAYAGGTTVIRDAAELKVKESDRIAIVVQNLKAMGADIEGTEDGMIIRGGRPLHGTTVHSCADHRIAMSFAVAGLNAEGTTEIEGAECVTISYPSFYSDLECLRRGKSR